jgi:hypothetical protein
MYIYGQESGLEVWLVIRKVYLKSVHFITIQHKLSGAFQTDMHNKVT